jgi:hypothetical protein
MSGLGSGMPKVLSVTTVTQVTVNFWAHVTANDGVAAND